ncbi:MAG TPA: hypothetical protein VGM19_14000 [Armatimonadota bacterium]
MKTSSPLSRALAAGDIVRTRWPLRMSDHLNLYLGNGRMGCGFDAWGLMNNGFRGERESLSNTALMHADHWHRGAWGLDCWFPAARLVWADEPPAPPTGYRQELCLAEGRLRTELTWPDLRLTISAWFNPDRRDLLAVDLEYEATREGAVPALLLAPGTEADLSYEQHLSGKVETVAHDTDWWLARLSMGTARTALGLRTITTSGAVKLVHGGEGLELHCSGLHGRHLLVLGVAAASREPALAADLRAVPAPEQYAAESAQAWARRWGDACIEIPVPEYQALWSRSLFWTLCSYAPEVRSPAPPMGWAGNYWGFHFPQDLSYIHPALLRLGHVDIARSWVEFYRGYLENMQEYTQRVYSAEGTMWAWEFPIGPDSQLLSEGAPNQFQYEIHNAAYPARMAREASRHLGDSDWTQEIAWPVVRESARFYASVLRPEADGTWGMQVIPSSGQDEMGGRDGKNYLDALFSAQYCLQTGLEMAGELGLAGDEFVRWDGILHEGLAYRRLVDSHTGLLATCEGLMGSGQIGKEKHPVQLNPLTFLPLGRASVDEYVRSAYQRRYELCAGVKEHIYYGWTLAAYWLAASHMGDAEGLLSELGQSLPGQYVDRDWTQIFETTGYPQSSYYVTSGGLYLQALNDALVSDYWGEVEIGAACPESWEQVSFHNLRTAGGRSWTGTKDGDNWRLEED